MVNMLKYVELNAVIVQMKSPMFPIERLVKVTASLQSKANLRIKAGLI